MTPDEIFNILKECADDMKIILFNFYNFAGTQREESHKEMLQNFLKK